MNEYIEVISQIKPKNNGNFPIADVNDLKGGYIQVDTIQQMQEFPKAKLKEGMLCYVADDMLGIFGQLRVLEEVQQLFKQFQHLQIQKTLI